MKSTRKIIALVMALVLFGIGLYYLRGSGWKEAVSISFAAGAIGFYFSYNFEPRLFGAFFSLKALRHFALVFVLLLFLPLFGNIFSNGKRAVLPEKEQGKQVELITPWALISRFIDEFDSRFVFRDRLIPGYNRVKIKLFGVSPVPKVIIGRSGWLFQARVNKEPNERGYFQSVLPFSEAGLKDWKDRLEERRDWLKERGIYYLVILAPDKASIYPEYLPGNLSGFYRESRLDQLLDYLKKHSTVPVLDLRSSLLNAKNDLKIYYKTDSHWNEPGALFAYRDIVNHLASVFGKEKKVRAKTLDDFRIKRRKLKNGNLSLMLAIKDHGFVEQRLRLRPRFRRTARKAPLPSIKIPKALKPAAMVSAKPDLPGAVMFHDSFGRNLKPFLSEHFSRILFLRDWGFRFHRDIIEVEKPKIVLDEIAEHFLYRVRLSN